MSERKQGFILVEVAEDTDEQLRRSMSIVRRSLHELQNDTGIIIADLPYYKEKGPKTRIGDGPIRYLSNFWDVFEVIFKDFRKDREQAKT